MQILLMLCLRPFRVLRTINYNSMDYFGRFELLKGVNVDKQGKEYCNWMDYWLVSWELPARILMFVFLFQRKYESFFSVVNLRHRRTLSWKAYLVHRPNGSWRTQGKHRPLLKSPPGWICWAIVSSVSFCSITMSSTSFSCWIFAETPTHHL